MEILESPARKAGKPLPPLKHRANTRFSRMIAACGLSQVEAAGYLGMSRQAVAMKAAALRPMFREEEVKLIDLWQAVMKGGLVGGVLPAGANRMMMAHMEMRALTSGAEGTDPKIL